MEALAGRATDGLQGLYPVPSGSTLKAYRLSLPEALVASAAACLSLHADGPRRRAAICCPEVSVGASEPNEREKRGTSRVLQNASAALQLCNGCHATCDRPN